MAQRPPLGRAVLCLFDCPSEDVLRRVLEALPADLDDWVAEVVAMDDRLVARADPAAIGRLRGTAPAPAPARIAPKKA